MQKLSNDLKAVDGVIKRVKAEMDARGLTKPKKKKKQRAVQGHKAARATMQRLHYAREVDRVREKNPRFKGFRSTVPAGGLPPRVGPSEKALERAARQA